MKKTNDKNDKIDKIDMTRRALLVGSASAVATTGALDATASAATTGPRGSARSVAAAPGVPGRDYAPVEVPNGAKLPFKIVGGVKVFHLIAEEVEHEMVPGLKVRCWGYNGRVHGPVIEAVEHDRVRIYVTNRLPESTTVHWHALLVPNGMDGVGGLTQKAIRPGDTFKYEMTLRQAGTAMYHSHHDEMTQMALGMTGLFVIHPRRSGGGGTGGGDRGGANTGGGHDVRDFALMLHEWRVDPGASRPDPLEMTEFNVLTINGRAFPGTDPLVVRTGQRVRIRIGNLSAMDHHPIHLHGYRFRVTETDGGPIPASAQWPETTVLVPVGSTRTIEFVADTPGDWALHCHMTHHLMTQMGHGVPNLIGVDPSKLDARVRKVLPGYMTMGANGMGDMADMDMPVPKNSVPMRATPGKYDPITMGGMFTLLKVRDDIKRSYADPGWYDAPADTIATNANATDLARDGIALGEHPTEHRD